MRKLTLVLAVLAGFSFSAMACGKKDDAAAKAKKEEKKAEEKKEEKKVEGGGGGGGGGGGEPGPGGPGSGTGGGNGGGGDGSGGTGKKEQQMANCPSAVAGATTTVAEAAGAVEVSVVGADDKAVAEIRKRASKLAEASKAAGAEAKHDSSGSGGGAVGYCPVVLGGTSVEYAEVDKGAKLTVKPEKADGLAALVAESKRRNEAMPKAP
jgi:hypothetical protein